MKIRLGLAAASLLLLSSCGIFIYKSPTVKTPLLSKKNDLNAQVNVGGAGYEAYAAYAVINNLGISASYAGYQEKADSFNHFSPTRTTDLELSAIPFYAKENLRFELPLGVGIAGRNKAIQDLVPTNPYQRYFAQPTFGISYPNLEFALFVRLTQLQYTNSLYGKDFRYEPGFMIRAGSKNFKGMLQIRLDDGKNYSKRQGTTLTEFQQAEYLPIHVSLGVSFSINTAKKKKTEDPKAAK